MRRSTAMIIGGWVSVLIAAPWVAAVSGADPEAIENRAPAPPPTLTVDRLAEPELYAEVADFFTDRIPLRAEGVYIDAWVDLNVFDDSPNERVLVGAEGWLFLRDEFTEPCIHRRPRDEMAAEVARLDRLLAASGRRLVVTIAPNKEAIYPGLAPAGETGECARASRRELREAMMEAGPSHYVDLWAVMENLARSSSEPVYFPRDSHWTWAGALAAAEALAGELAPEVWDPGAVRSVPDVPYEAGLMKLIGMPAFDHATEYSIDRGFDLVQTGTAPRRGPNHYLVPASSTSVPGVTLVIHDSFGEMIEPDLAPFLEESIWYNWQLMEREDDSGYAWLAEHVSAADTVVVETVERLTYRRFGSMWDELAAYLAGALLADLPGVELLQEPSGHVRLGKAGAGDRYLVMDVDSDGPIEVVTGTGAALKPVPVPDSDTPSGLRWVVEVPSEVTDIQIEGAGPGAEIILVEIP